MKFIRAFCYGLNPGEETIAEIAGQTVLFSYDTPQVDIQVDAEANPEPAAAADAGTVSDSNTTTL